MPALPARAVALAIGGALVFGVLLYRTITCFVLDPAANVAAHTRLLFMASTAILLGAMALRPVALTLPSRHRAVWVALVVAFGVSILGSPVPAQSLDRAIFYAGLIVWGWAVYTWHGSEEPLVLTPYLVAVVVVHLLVLMEVVFWMIDHQPISAMRRLPIPFHANPRHFGYLGYLAAACALCLVWVGGRHVRLAGVLLGALGLWGAALLGTRATFLAWAVFTVLATALGGRLRLRLLGASLFAVALALGATWAAQHFGWLVTETLYDRPPPLPGHNPMSGRTGLWWDAIRSIAERPWFGWGPDGQALMKCCFEAGPQLTYAVQPHNAVLQLLQDFGLVGAGLMSWLGWQALRGRQFGWLRTTPERACLAAMLGGYLAYAMVDGMLYHAAPLVVFSTATALLAAQGHKRTPAGHLTDPGSTGESRP